MECLLGQRAVNLCLLLVLNGSRSASAEEDFAKVLVPEGESPEAFLETPWRDLSLLHAVAWSPDGKLLATGGFRDKEGRVRVWDLASGQAIRSLEGLADGICWLRFSSDGKSLATGSDKSDGVMGRLWDVASGKSLRSFVGRDAGSGFLSFSLDGRSIMTSFNESSIHIRDAASGEPRRSLVGHEYLAEEFGVSPDGKLFAAGFYALAAGTVQIWDIPSSKSLLSLVGHRSQINSVRFSPDGKYLATGSDDFTARIWDVASGKSLRSLEGHKRAVVSLHFSPDGKYLATGSHDATARIWDVASGRLLRSLEGHQYTVWSVRFSPDGRSIATASADGTARVWDVASGKSLRWLVGHRVLVSAISISPDGRSIATGSEDGTALLWDLASSKALRSIQGHSDPVSAVSISPDGKSLATGSNDYTARVWDLVSGRALGSPLEHTSKVAWLDFSPDGKSIATGSERTFRVWDLASGTIRRSMEGLYDNDWRSAGRFSPDGKSIAIEADGGAYIRDLASGNAIQWLAGHIVPASAVRFSPDSRSIVTGSHDGVPLIWSFTAGKSLRFLKGPKGSDSSECSIPDGRSNASEPSDPEVLFWRKIFGVPPRPRNAREVKACKARERNDLVAGAHISPDGKSLVGVAYDGIGRIWDIASGRVLHSLAGYKTASAAPRFSPDGKFFAAALDDGSTRIWDLASGRTLAIFRGVGSNWAVLVGGRLYRHDDGRLLYRQAGSSVSAVLPPKPAREPQLSLQIVESRPVKNTATGFVRVRIDNAASAGRAYWLRFSSADLPRSMNLIAPPVHLRLEPGESVTLPVEVSTLTPAYREPATERARFTLQLEHAFGLGPSVPIDLLRVAP